MAKILVVEDDKHLNILICSNLSLVGHSCDSLFDGMPVYERLCEKHYDLMILDVMLPGMNGFEVLSSLEDHHLPVIFLTAKNDLKDRLAGLRLGADDYIIKPFELLELQARVDVVLRRVNKTDKKFSIGELKIDFEARTVYRMNEEIECAPKEFELLEILIRNRNIALSREKLLELVWGFDYEGETRTVDVHIQRLRSKLNLDSKIKTVHKIGYRLEIKNED